MHSCRSKRAGTPERVFVSTLQNPLYAAARLQAYAREDITRAFSLVATFEICPANEEVGHRFGI